jgi:thiol peroxidase
MVERPADVIFKGKPQTVRGRKLKVGDKAPGFTLTANDWSKVSLADSAGKVRLLSVVTALDTGICDAQTRRFNQEIAQYGDKAICYTISADLPQTQSRWCGAAGIDRVQTLSDHFDMSFGDAYGTHIKEIRLEQRAMFVVDGAGAVRYVEYVPAVAQHPNYDDALAALKEVVG